MSKSFHLSLFPNLPPEVVKAFVVLAKGAEASAALAEELQAHVKRRLSAHAYPRLVEFVTELPKTPSGKIQRFLLRKAEVERAQTGAAPDGYGTEFREEDLDLQR